MPYEIGSRRSWYNWRISFYTVRYLNIQWYLVSTLVTADDLFRPLTSPPCFEGTEEAQSARGRILKMIVDERVDDVDSDLPGINLSGDVFTIACIRVSSRRACW